MASLAAQQKAAALYFAVIGKNATADAYDFFGQQLEGGSKTLITLTESLLASSEASARFSGKTLEQIITQVYTSVYGSAPAATPLSELISEGTTSAALAKLVDDLLNYNGFDEGTLATQASFEATIDTILFPVTQTSATAGSADVQALYYSLGKSQAQSGINYWGTVLANGSKTFSEVANAFATSTTALKALSNDDFVNFVFQNTYSRAATTTEVDQYVNALTGGSSRGDVLVDIITAIRGSVATGDTAAQTNFNAATKVYQPGELPDLNFQEQAASIYLAVPERGIDARALDTWGKELAAGKSFTALNAKLLASAEFQNKGAQLTGDAFIQHVFTAVNGIAADTTQLAAYSSLGSKEAITSAIIQDLRNSVATDNATVTQQHAFEADIGTSLLYKTAASLTATAVGGNATGTVNTGSSHVLSNAETAVLTNVILDANAASNVNLKFADNLDNLTINGTSAATVNLSDNGVNDGVAITVNNSNVVLNGSSGADIATVTSAANIAGGSADFNLGAGNDTLKWAGNATTGANTVGAGISGNGGQGTDIISANFITKSVATTSNVLGIRSSTITSNANNFTSFEKVDLAGYIGKSVGTLNGAAVTTAANTFDFGLLNGSATVEGTAGGTITQANVPTALGTQGFVLSGLADAVKVINAAGGSAAQLEVTGDATTASNLDFTFVQNATNKFDISFTATSNTDINAGSISLNSSSSALLGTALATVNIASGGTGDFDNSLSLVGTNSQVQTINVTGDHTLDLTLSSGFSNVRTINASSNTGGLNLDSDHGGTGDGLIVQLLNALPLGALTTALLTPVLTALGLNGYQLNVTGTGTADTFDIASNTSVTGGAGANTYDLKSSTSSAGVTINDFSSTKDNIIDGLSGLEISNDTAGTAVADYGTRSADLLDGILGSLLGGVVGSAAGLLGGILGLDNSNSLTSKVGVASVVFDGLNADSYVIIDNNDNGTLDNADSVIYLTDQNHQNLLDTLHYAPQVALNGVVNAPVSELTIA
ncbi:beta strand repeat-containing protein [Serratia sp. NPDC078593]|uniref:beta strand repeat-containing protein n=1 Tax=unclassified Serratia (in: enterobacteria) TaxID=2647522 RepID=UPI0037D44BD3